MDEDELLYKRWDKMKRSKDVAERIVAAILDDVTDRRGWRQEWEQFDVEVRNEIIDKWLSIIRRRLK